MNRYKITATRSNGTELSDYFIEATEGAARKAFKECYRNEEYSDVKAELVAEYVQATKEQEREALAKIVKIVDDLGPDSYVGIAFEGCFKDAEDSAAARKRMEESAEIMAETADKPRDIAFKGAVESYRKAKERRERCERLLAGLDENAPKQ